MAWYALYKWFTPWRKASYINWVNWYKRHLYDEWFNSLSEEAKKVELERQQRIKEKRKHEAEKALEHLGIMLNTMNELTHGKMGDYMEDVRFINRISTNPSKYW